MNLYALRVNEDIDFAKDVGEMFFPRSIQERVSKKKGRARTRSALAYLFLRYCLKKEGKESCFERVEFTSKGKPYVDGVEFSLSHTRGMIVCAVSEDKVGVDVEKIRKIPESAVKRYVDEEYLNRIVNIEDRDLLAVEQWVIKEALLKEQGRGISVKLKTIIPSQISEHVFQIEGRSIATYREGEFLIALSTKGDIPQKIISIRINDII